MLELFKKYIIPGLVSLFVVVLFFFLRTSPAYKLWKGYTVLSVDYNADKKLVSNVLAETGCGDVISLEAQRAEDFSFFTPFLATEEEDSYNKNKALYFFDKDRRVALYYIPDGNKDQAQEAATILNQNYGIGAMLDSHNGFPYLVPIVLLIVFIAFTVFAENKIVFVLSGAIPFVFSICNPLYSVAAAVCLELYAFYLAQKVWRRRGGTQFLLTNAYFWVFNILAMVFVFTMGFVLGILFILNFCAAASLLFILLNLQEEYEKRFRFIPVLIRNAKMAGAMNHKSVKTMLFCSCGVFLLLILFLTGANFSSGNSEKDLFFPAPNEYNEKSNKFPSLEDFFARKWNSIAMQYRSLNERLANNGASCFVHPTEGETISQMRYLKEGSEIKAVKEILCTYDEKFRREARENIESSDYPAIEKLWIEQGGKFSTEYAANGSVGDEGGIPLVILLIAMFMPLGVAFNYIFIWRKKRNVF